MKAIGIKQLQLHVKMLNEEAWDDVTHTSSDFGLIEVFGFTITENGKIKKVKMKVMNLQAKVIGLHLLHLLQRNPLKNL